MAMISYGCFYEAISEKNAFSNLSDSPYFHASCFSATYSSASKYDKFKVYVLKKYNTAKINGANLKYSSKEVYEFAFYLKCCGFKFNVEEANVFIPKIDETVDSYIFHIPVKQNSNLGVLLMLNAVRYLYEYDLNKIADRFLQFCREKRGPHLLNRFFAAHLIGNLVNANHCITSSHSKLMHYLNDKEINEVLTDPKTYISTDGVPHFRMTGSNLNIPKLSDEALSLSPQEAFSHYKKISDSNR
jgi:hypothetical protein